MSITHEHHIYTHMFMHVLYICHKHVFTLHACTHVLTLHAYGHRMHECADTYIHIPLRVCAPSAHIYTTCTHATCHMLMHAAAILKPAHSVPLHNAPLSITNNSLKGIGCVSYIK